MSVLKDVTDDSFEATVVASPRPVIVEYWAQWCPPCRQLAPILDAMADELAGRVDVVKLNIDENPLTAQRYAITHVPTINLFNGGEVVKQLVGVRSKASLQHEFESLI